MIMSVQKAKKKKDYLKPQTMPHLHIQPLELGSSWVEGSQGAWEH